MRALALLGIAALTSCQGSKLGGDELQVSPYFGAANVIAVEVALGSNALGIGLSWRPIHDPKAVRYEPVETPIIYPQK